MSSPNWNCPRCGGVVPGTGEDGLCPVCLLLSAIEAPIDDTDSSLSDSVYGGTGRLRRPPSQLRYFGDYQIMGELARGGMGVVYLARQTSLDRWVAVKLLLLGEFSSPAAVARFRTEAAAAARLQHPGIVAIYEIGEHEGQQFYSMEYVPGENLARQVIRQPPIPRAAAVQLLEIVDAVHYAHTQGILHRDLKPANVLVTPDGRARVTDFGLAKRLDGHSELTGTGEMMGSPSFMAPEQVRGDVESIGVPTDVYGLGAMLYYSLTGRAPLQASTVAATLDLVLRDDPISPRVLNPSVPRDLETICLKCLAKVPEQRYSDAAALGADLRRFLADEPICARPIDRWERAWRWARRNPARAGLVAAAVFLILAVAAGGFFYGRQREAARTREVGLRAESERQRYAMSINLAERARTEGDFPQADKLLQEVIPRPGDEDLRGWEWYHLRHELRGREERVLWSGTNEVLALAASPKGDRIAVAWERELRLLAMESGETLAQWTLPAAGDGNRVLLFTPDGAALVAGAVSGAVLFRPGQPGRTLLTEPANVLAFSSDGSQMAFSSVDWSRGMDASVAAGILQMPSGRITDRVTTNGGPGLAWVESAAGTGSGFEMLSSRGVLSFWQTGREPEIQWGRLHFTDYAVFSPDRRQVLVDDIWGFYDWLMLPSGMRTREPPPPHLRLPWSVTRPMLAFRRDGARVAMKNGGDRRIAVCDGTTGEVLHRYPGHRGELTGLAFLGNSGALVSSSRDGTVRLWDSERAPGNLRITNNVKSLGLPRPVFSPDSQLVALITNGSIPEVTSIVWDLSEARPVSSFEGFALGFSNSGKDLLVWRGTNQFRRLSKESGDVQVGQSIKFSSDVGRNIFLNDGHSIVYRHISGEIYIWDFMLQTEPKIIVSDSSSLVVSDLGDTFATAVQDGVAIWDSFLKKLVIVSKKDAQAFRFSSDSKLLASGDIDGNITILECVSRKVLKELKGHGGEVYVVVFTPDQRTLVSAAEDRTLRFWNVNTGALLFSRSIPENAHWAEFSPDGLWLAFGWRGAYELLSRERGGALIVPKTQNQPWDILADDMVPTRSPAATRKSE